MVGATFSPRNHPNNSSTPIPSWTPVLFRFLELGHNGTKLSFFRLESPQLPSPHQNHALLLDWGTKMFFLNFHFLQYVTLKFSCLTFAVLFESKSIFHYCAYVLACVHCCAMTYQLLTPKKKTKYYSCCFAIIITFIISWKK